MNRILHHFDLHRCIQRIFVEFMGFPTAGTSINFGGATKTIGVDALWWHPPSTQVSETDNGHVPN